MALRRRASRQGDKAEKQENSDDKKAPPADKNVDKKASPADENENESRVMSVPGKIVGASVEPVLLVVIARIPGRRADTTSQDRRRSRSSRPKRRSGSRRG